LRLAEGDITRQGDETGETPLGRDPRVEFLGKSTKNISANDQMWEFFKRHPMH
jgi:poly(3-hydroxybutyrate) depolymerase